MGSGESVRDMFSKFAKLEKFEGQDFRRWKKKMHFLLTTLKVAYVLSTPIPDIVEDETLDQQRRRLKWENDDYICRGHILNRMTDSLFDVYQNAESAKDLWDSLEAKYMAEDASSKKFLDDETAWWVDSGATSNVCKDLRWIEDLKTIEDGSVLRMGNVATEPIKGIGNVKLVFTSGKQLILYNVLYVPGIRKNLLS